MSEENYKLKSLTSYRNSFNLVKLVAVVIVIAIVIPFSIAHYMAVQEIKESKDELFYQDITGNVFKAKTKDYTTEDYKVEINNHIKMFVNLWYEFDEGSFEPNLKKGVNLIGDCSQSMLDFYVSKKIADKLKENNTNFKAEVLEIKLDLESTPHRGRVLIKQTITRGLNALERVFFADFIILKDGIARSNDNPHGLKLDNWKTTNVDNEEKK